MMKITNKAELNRAIDSLPAFTLSVYRAAVKATETVDEELGDINKSDFYLDNVYSDTISRTAATGAFSKLSEAGLYEPLDDCFGLILEEA